MLIPKGIPRSLKRHTHISISAFTSQSPALIAEDALLLHPEKVQGGYKGLLVAKESAGDQRRAFVNSIGEVIHLTVPYVRTKVVADEGVTLIQ